MKRSPKVAAVPSYSNRPISSYGKDRTCLVCEVRLSRYNESLACGVHDGWGGRFGSSLPTAARS